MKNWFANLSEREKFLVLGGGAIAVILLLYFLLWLPFSVKIANEQSTLAAQKQLLSWMQPATQQVLELQKTQTKAQKVGAGSLLSTVDRSLKQSALAKFSVQIDQTDNNQVNVQFNSIPFDPLVSWLIEVNKRYHISVQQLSLTSEATIGMVKGQVTLGL